MLNLKVDKEEFQQWKASPLTQWVLQTLEARASEVEDQLKASLYSQTGLGVTDWANLQARAAYDKGVATALRYVVGLEIEDIVDEPDGAQTS